MVTGPLLSMLAGQAVILRNLFLLEWNSKYLTTDARTDLGPAACFHVNSGDTKLMQDVLQRYIQLALSNETYT